MFRSSRWRQLIVSRIVLGFSFCIVVFVFGVAYLLAWEFRPDYFVIQQELNLYPIGSIDALLNSGQFNSISLEAGGLAELSTHANQLVKSAKELNDRERALRLEIENLEAELKRLSARLEENRQKRIEQYKYQELHSLEGERDQLQTRIADLEKQIPKDGTVYNPLRLVIAEMRVDLSRLDLRLSQRRLEVANRIVEDFGAFAEPADFEAFKTVYDRIGVALKEVIDISSRQGQLRMEAYELAARWREQRASRLRLIDFMYFSIGVSTTTTFGDIIPNHSVTRFIVTVQLLISIVIVGLFINALFIALREEPRLGPGIPLRRRRRRASSSMLY